MIMHHSGGRRGTWLFLILLLLLSAPLYSQSQPGTGSVSSNLNSYYRFPFSLSAEYESLSPFGTYGATFNAYQISGLLRWPIPPLPVVQPTFKAGMMQFDSRDLSEPAKWSHSNWFAALGISFSHRFAKTFEVGAEVLGGFAESYFPSLLPEVGTVGYGNLYLEGGGRISLDPSFNFSVDVHPSIKYLKSFGPLSDFDGLLLGVGFSIHYRFGQDPDAPQTIIRALRFSDAGIPPAFAAMQSYYVKHPLGEVTITNTEKDVVTDLEVSFHQAGYMDSPTHAASIPELRGGESVKVPLLASFNSEVFTTEGVTPLTGEIIAAYKVRGRAAEQRQSVSYDLHDKTAVTWDDDRKVAAFITPSDSALRNYASFIRQSCKEATIPSFNDSIQYGMQLFAALGEIGCLYQADPALPFTKAQGDPLVVDSISLPRDTLKRITGDCDDLTVVYCSLLEAAGVQSAFITVPGHIYAAFNTKVPAGRYQLVHPDRRMTIAVEGELWVPVEITMVGQADFLSAWRKGMEEWSLYDERPEKRSFYVTQKSQEIYRPVGLKETDLGLQYGDREAIQREFKRDLGKLADLMVQDLVSVTRERGRKEDFNRLGIRYAQLHRLEPAEQSFRRALQIDPSYLSPQINLGNLLYLREQYSEALARFERTLALLRRSGKGATSIAAKVLLNMSRASYLLDRYDSAASLYAQAAELDPEEAQRFAFLAGSGAGDARAAEQINPRTDILFVEEE